MITEYQSKDQNFSSRLTGTYFKLGFMIPVGGLAVVALAYALIYYEGPHRRSKIGRILEGLSNMSVTSIAVTLLTCFIIFIALVNFLRFYYGKREIVVALKFDDHLEELTVTTKTVRNQEFVRTHKYAELLMEGNHLSDGMTPAMYNTLTLIKGKFLAGHVYMNHFTWDQTTLSKIRMKLGNVLGSSTESVRM